MPIVEIYDKPGVGRRLRVIKQEDLVRRGVRTEETPAGELVKLHHNFYSSRAADGYTPEPPPAPEPAPAPAPAPAPEPSPPPAPAPAPAPTPPAVRARTTAKPGGGK
jgi:hypothetical protein